MSPREHDILVTTDNLQPPEITSIKMNDGVGVVEDALPDHHPLRPPPIWMIP